MVAYTLINKGGTASPNSDYLPFTYLNLVNAPSGRARTGQSLTWDWTASPPALSYKLAVYFINQATTEYTNMFPPSGRVTINVTTPVTGSSFYGYVIAYASGNQSGNNFIYGTLSPNYSL